jgi:hypothetical protein
MKINWVRILPSRLKQIRIKKVTSKTSFQVTIKFLQRLKIQIKQAPKISQYQKVPMIKLLSMIRTFLPTKKSRTIAVLLLKAGSHLLLLRQAKMIRVLKKLKILEEFPLSRCQPCSAFLVRTNEIHLCLTASQRSKDSQWPLFRDLKMPSLPIQAGTYLPRTLRSQSQTRLQKRNRKLPTIMQKMTRLCHYQPSIKSPRTTTRQPLSCT